MPISAGFQTDNLGAISMYQRQSTVTRQVNGVAVDSVGNVFYANAATVGVSLIKRAGLLWTVDGAICVTTTDPGNTRQVNGFKVSAAGEMFVTTTAPAPTSQVTFDPILGYLRVSNSGAVHVAPFPALDANLAAFYLPSVGQTNVSGACSQWNDQSGNSRNLLQSTAAARPLINNDGSLTGDGADDIMQTSAFGVALSVPYVVTALVKQNGWTIGRTLLDRLTGGPTTFSAVFQNGSSPTVSQFHTAVGASVSPAIGAWAVIQAVFTGDANASLRLNNSAAVTGNAGTATLDGFTMFARNDNTNWASVTIAGASIRSTNDATVNANDRNFWMRVGNL